MVDVDAKSEEEAKVNQVKSNTPSEIENEVSKVKDFKAAANTTIKISLNSSSPRRVHSAGISDFTEPKDTKRKENSSDNSANLVVQSTLSKTPPTSGK